MNIHKTITKKGAYFQEKKKRKKKKPMILRNYGKFLNHSWKTIEKIANRPFS